MIMLTAALSIALPALISYAETCNSYTFRTFISKAATATINGINYHLDYKSVSTTGKITIAHDEWYIIDPPRNKNFEASVHLKWKPQKGNSGAPEYPAGKIDVDGPSKGQCDSLRVTAQYTQMAWDSKPSGIPNIKCKVLINRGSSWFSKEATVKISIH